MNIFLLSVVLYKEAYFLNSNFFQKLLARSISNVPRYSVLLIYRVSIKKHIVDYLNFEEKKTCFDTWRTKYHYRLPIFIILFL